MNWFMSDWVHVCTFWFYVIFIGCDLHRFGFRLLKKIYKKSFDVRFAAVAMCPSNFPDRHNLLKNARVPQKRKACSKKHSDSNQKLAAKHKTAHKCQLETLLLVNTEQPSRYFTSTKKLENPAKPTDIVYKCCLISCVLYSLA